MTVHVFVSAPGSPGATTAVLALAAAWPRPVAVIEADPSGSSAVLAGHLRGQVAGTAGVIDAAVALRSGSLFQAWPDLVVPLPGSAAVLLPGLANPAQRITMASQWQHLGPALSDLAAYSGFDLLVDAGRPGPDGFATPLLALADLVLLTCRSTLRSVHATSAWVDHLQSSLPDPDRLRLLVIGPGRPYQPRELTDYLMVPVAAALPWDPPSAAWYSDGSVSRSRGRRSGQLEGYVHKWALALAAGQHPDQGPDRDLRLDLDLRTGAEVLAHA